MGERRIFRFLVAAGVVFIANVSVATAALTAGATAVAAAALAYVVTIVTHFSIQRWWVFRDRRELQEPVSRQLPPYLITVVAQWAVVAWSVPWVAERLGLDHRFAYIGVVVLAAGCTYVVFARLVFRVAADSR